VSSDGLIGATVSLQSSVPDLYGAVASAWRNGDFAGAVALAQTILEREPGHVGASEIVGVVLLQQGKISDAYGALKRVSQVQVLSEIAQCRLAEAAQASGRSEEVFRVIYLQHDETDYSGRFQNKLT